MQREMQQEMQRMKEQKQPNCEDIEGFQTADIRVNLSTRIGLITIQEWHLKECKENGKISYMAQEFSNGRWS